MFPEGPLQGKNADQRHLTSPVPAYVRQRGWRMGVIRGAVCFRVYEMNLDDRALVQAFGLGV